MTLPNSRSVSLDTFEGCADALLLGADAADIGIIALSLETMPQVLYVNQAASRLLGYPPDRISLAPDSPTRSVLLDCWTRRAESDSPCVMIAPWVRPDGTQVDIEIAAGLASTAEQTLEVLFLGRCTGQERARAALLRSEQRFSKLVESVQAAVWIVTEEGLVYANPAACSLLGLDRSADLRGTDLRAFLHAADRAGFERSISAMLQNGVRVPSFECRARASDGRLITLEVSGTPLEHEGRASVLCFARDVTERKQLEQRVRQSDRLAALGLLAGGIAHAINNPLTYVLLHLEHLARCMPSVDRDEKTRADALDSIREAHSGAERVAAVVRRMRAFCRPDDASSMPIDPRALLESVLELVGNELRHRGKLLADLAPVPPIVGNQAGLEQALLNLMIYAARALPEDGQEQHVRVVLRQRDATSVMVEVVASGAPPAPESTLALVDPFHLLGDTEERSDFGLSVCHTIVSAMHGTLEIGPSAEGGTRLALTFPCALEEDSSPDAVTPDRPASERVPMARGRILVVDDDAGVGRVVTQLLQERHEVVWVQRAREARDLLLSGPRYDVVLCDLMMPEYTGAELYELVRSARPGAEHEFVFMTGGACTPQLEQFLARVENARLEKPFTSEALQDLLDAVLTRRGQSAREAL